MDGAGEPRQDRLAVGVPWCGPAGHGRRCVAVAGSVDVADGGAAPGERPNRAPAAWPPPGGEEPARDRRGAGRTAAARPHPRAPDRPPALAGPPATAHDRLGDRLQRRPMP